MANKKQTKKSVNFELLRQFRDEIDALLAAAEGASADTDDEDDEEETPAKTSKKSATKGKTATKKSAEPEDDEDDSGEDDDEDESGDEPTTQELVESATEDMDDDELREFCEENDLSTKGKRQALIARIVKAVENGDIELDLDGDDDADDDEDEDEEEPPKKSSKKNDKKSAADEKKSSKGADKKSGKQSKRDKAIAEHEKNTRQQFKDGELDRDELVDFLCDFYGKDKKTYKKADDKTILDMYIEASSNLISDEGEIVEEGAYMVNEEPYCCGRPLTYDDENEQYVCEHCGAEYDASDDEDDE